MRDVVGHDGHGVTPAGPLTSVGSRSARTHWNCSAWRAIRSPGGAEFGGSPVEMGAQGWHGTGRSPKIDLPSPGCFSACQVTFVNDPERSHATISTAS